MNSNDSTDITEAEVLQATNTTDARDISLKISDVVRSGFELRGHTLKRWQGHHYWRVAFAHNGTDDVTTRLYRVDWMTP